MSPPPTPTLTHTSAPTATRLMATASPVLPSRTTTAPPGPTFTSPAATPDATCEITALSATNVYVRPFLTAGIFGTLSAGMKITVLGRTPNNWYAFDPGVAQAGNVGIFRMRWVPAAASLSIPQACLNLGKVYSKVPQPGICYAMVMGISRVYRSPLTTAPVVVTFGEGDWAKVLGKYGTWIKLDLSDSVIDSTNQGWISQDQVGLNGCPLTLPSVTP